MSGESHEIVHARKRKYNAIFIKSTKIAYILLKKSQKTRN